MRKIWATALMTLAMTGLMTVSAGAVDTVTVGIEGATYNTIAAAFTAEQYDIQLVTDIDEDVVIAEDKTVTIDLNGQTLTNDGDHTITNSGTLTITGTGTVDNVTDAKGALVNYGTAILSGGLFERSAETGTEANTWYTVENYATMTINDGVTIKNSGGWSSLLHNGWMNGSQNTSRTNSVMTINGGTFDGGLNTVKNDDYGEMIINNGTFKNYTQAVVLNWNILTINDGDFITDTGYTAILNGYIDDTMDNGRVTLNGGNFTCSDLYDEMVWGAYSGDGTTLIIGDDFQVEAGQIITIVSGATLTVNTGKTLTNEGTIVVNDAAALATAIAAGGTVELGSNIDLTAPLTIAKSVTINGNGNTITAAAGKQAFQIASGAEEVTFETVTITGANPGDSTNGGAVFINNNITSVVTFDTCVLTENNASQGGAIFNADRSNNVTIIFKDTEVSDNTSPNGYAGVAGYSGQYQFLGTTSFVNNQGATFIYPATSVIIDDTVTFENNYREASENNYSLVIGSSTALTLNVTGTADVTPIPLRINSRDNWTAAFTVTGAELDAADLYKYIDSEIYNTAFQWDKETDLISMDAVYVNTQDQFAYYLGTGDNFSITSDLTLAGDCEFSQDVTISAGATLTIPTGITLTNAGGILNGTTITFDAGSGSCDTAAVIVAADNTLSTIPTATLSGCRFNGWTAEGVSGYVTTSTEFSADTTLTASFTRISSGGSSSGGSSSTTTTPDTTTNTDGSVNASVSTSTSTSGSTSTATVTDSKVESAIEAAVEAAKGETATVEIAVSAKSSTDTVSAVISADAATSIADSAVESLVVSSDIGTLSIPSEALTAIADQADGAEIAITVAQVEAPVDNKSLADATIVDLTISAGDKTISSFGGSKIAVSVPYTLKDGEDASNIVVWYIADDGKITPMETTFDAETGTATFTTAHFSVYAIVHDTNTFTDVDVNAYYYDAVQWAVENEITGGKDEFTFAPTESCTRAQAVTFLWRAAGCPEATIDNPFSDLVEGAYYYNAVLWAVENGITTGYADGTFAPSATCTRGQIVTFMYRAAGEPAVSGTAMSDVAAGTYCYNAVLWAVENGITTGYADGTFGPNTTCNRGAIVTFLYRNLAD